MPEDALVRPAAGQEEVAARAESLPVAGRRIAIDDPRHAVQPLTVHELVEARERVDPGQPLGRLLGAGCERELDDLLGVLGETPPVVEATRDRDPAGLEAEGAPGHGSGVNALGARGAVEGLDGVVHGAGYTPRHRRSRLGGACSQDLRRSTTLARDRRVPTLSQWRRCGGVTDADRGVKDPGHCKTCGFARLCLTRGTDRDSSGRSDSCPTSPKQTREVALMPRLRL